MMVDLPDGALIYKHGSTFFYYEIRKNPVLIELS